jgi:hypothetical protein
MIVDIKFFHGSPVQIQNLRRISVFPHSEYGYDGIRDASTIETEAMLILYSKDDNVSPQHWILADIQKYWITED